METEKFSFPLKNRKYKKLLSSNAFYTFAIITLLFEVGCSFFIYYLTYNSYTTHIHSQLVIEANRIENTLQDVFTETHQVMMYVGKQIALHSEYDPHFIEKILVNSPEFVSKMKNIYPWSLFDWVDPNDFRIINSQIGLLRDAPTKVIDSYTWKCPKYPWTLQLSHPTIGNTSGMWVIPAGMGVLSKTNKYLGTLNVGFNIAELNAKIQQILASNVVSFIVLDDDLRIVLQSADNSIDPKSSYYRDILSDKNYFTEDKNTLSPPLSYKDIKYTYYKKIKNYPYFILTGFDKKLAQHEFWVLLLPRLLELYGVGFFCLCLLYLLRKKLFILGKISGTAKKTFLQRINTEMKESIETILAYSNILIKHLREETGVIVTKERKIEFIEKIYEAALNLHTLAGSTLNFNYITINTLIENSIAILTEIALKKNINIKASLDPSLLSFYGDELRLQQIIVGLISLSMEYSPKGSTIKVSATNKLSRDNQMLLIVKIEDNGFSLNADDIMRISERFPHDEKEEEALGSHLDFPSIERLIRLLKGTFYICNKWQKGKIINVTLPYPMESEETEAQGSDQKNVYWLFEKPNSHSLKEI